MPTKTFDLVATYTADGTTNAASFSSLSGYTTYCIVTLLACGSNVRPTLRFNSVAGSNYGNVAWTISGATPSIGEQDSLSIWDTSSPTNCVDNSIGNNIGVIEISAPTSNVVYASFNAKQYSAGLGTYSLSAGQVYPSGQTLSSLFIGNSSSANFTSGSIIYLFGLV